MNLTWLVRRSQVGARSLTSSRRGRGLSLGVETNDRIWGGLSLAFENIKSGDYCIIVIVIHRSH